MLKTKELIEYLSRFNPDSEVTIMALDKGKRIVFQTMETIFLIDQGHPAIFIEIGEVEPFESGNE